MRRPHNQLDAIDRKACTWDRFKGTPVHDLRDKIDTQLNGKLRLRLFLKINSKIWSINKAQFWDQIVSRPPEELEYKN